jgi:hypothetical protein
MTLSRGRPAVALLLSLALPGCIILPRAGDRVGRDVMVRPSDLKPGQTTKADLIARLGPPHAIVEREGYTQVRSSSLPLPGRSGQPLASDATYVVQGEAWFAPFAERRTFGPAHRVYYWTSTASGGFMVLAPAMVIKRGYASVDELWALVDEETGLVLEVVARRTG